MLFLPKYCCSSSCLFSLSWCFAVSWIRPIFWFVFFARVLFCCGFQRKSTGETYLRVFGLQSPPLHDPLAIAFAIDESLFETRFLNVEVEMGSSLCFGQTVADVDLVSGRAPNVHVATKVNTEKFWDLMLQACELCVQKEESERT